MQAVRAVGFDFDHTLGIDNKLERVAFLQLLEVIVADGGAPRGTLFQETAEIDTILARQRAGHCTIEAAVEQFAAERSARHPQAFFARYSAFCVGAVETFVIPDTQTRPLLQRLREKGVPYALLTNGWEALQQAKALRVGFDGPVLVSSTLGVEKPKPAAFAAVADALGVALSQLAYVGDNAAVDAQGAEAAGAVGIWLDAEGATYPSGPPPSATIHTLAQLAELL